jgi:hypothetical protein
MYGAIKLVYQRKMFLEFLQGVGDDALSERVPHSTVVVRNKRHVKYRPDPFPISQSFFVEVEPPIIVSFP